MILLIWMYEEHLKHLDVAVTQLPCYGLNIKSSKCHFLKEGIL